MEKWLDNPVTVLVVLGVIAAVLRVGKWWGDVNSDRSSLKDSVEKNSSSIRDLAREIRDDIKKILLKLPSQEVSSTSPLRLTEYGEKLASQVNAEEIASLIYPTVRDRLEGKSPYEIQEFCINYVVSRFKPNEEQLRAIHQCAYENGTGVENVRRVVGIVLRDKILALETSQ